MLRVLLLIEDYNEQSFLEGILKRTGFDVEGIRNEPSLAEKMVAFRPEVVVATGDGKKINGARLSKRVKTKQISAKLILLYPRSQIERGIVMESSLADAGLETPVHPLSLLKTLCELGKVDEKFVLGKYEKLSVSKDYAQKSEGFKIVSGKHSNVPKLGILSEGPSRLDRKKDKARTSAYSKYLKDLPETGQSSMPKKMVQQEIKYLREGSNSEETKRIDLSRQEFAEKLFKKQK